VGFVHFFIVWLRRGLTAAWSPVVDDPCSPGSLGVGVGIGIGIDSFRVSQNLECHRNDRPARHTRSMYGTHPVSRVQIPSFVLRYRFRYRLRPRLQTLPRSGRVAIREPPPGAGCWRSACSWFLSVSGSESGSGSIPTGGLGLVLTHGVASLPEFRQHHNDAVQQGRPSRHTRVEMYGTHPVSRVQIPSFVLRYRFRYRLRPRLQTLPRSGSVCPVLKICPNTRCCAREPIIRLCRTSPSAPPVFSKARRSAHHFQTASANCRRRSPVGSCGHHFPIQEYPAREIARFAPMTA
jgi:hypothetical protein